MPGSFSAINSAFVVDIQQGINEDFCRTTAKLLRVLVQDADATALGEHVDPPSLNWKLSDISYVGVQSTMYASLAVLGRQWLN